MAWIVYDLDDTLIQQDEAGNVLPIDGAVEAVMEDLAAGHQVTVYTARFGVMPAPRRDELAGHLALLLQQVGFPPEMNIWTSYGKPNADLFYDNKAVTFDGDWSMARAQGQMMLEERGLVPPSMPQPGDLEPQEQQLPPDEDTTAGAPPQEEQPEKPPAKPEKNDSKKPVEKKEKSK